MSTQPRVGTEQGVLVGDQLGHQRLGGGDGAVADGDVRRLVDVGRERGGDLRIDERDLVFRRLQVLVQLVDVGLLGFVDLGTELLDVRRDVGVGDVTSPFRGRCRPGHEDDVRLRLVFDRDCRLHAPRGLAVAELRGDALGQLRRVQDAELADDVTIGIAGEADGDPRLARRRHVEHGPGVVLGRRVRRRELASGRAERDEQDDDPRPAFDGVDEERELHEDPFSTRAPPDVV